MTFKKKVFCSVCSSQLLRVTWNYGRNREIKNFFCDNGCKGKWQIMEREKMGFTKEWLEAEYLEKGKGANEIAKEIGRDPKRVWEWIRDYGIPTRPRGSDKNQQFKKGDESPFKGRTHTREARERFRQLRLEDGRVPYLKNGKHWLKHKNAKHPNWKGGLTPERQAFYASDEWKVAVKEVWKRDNAICQRCGKSHNGDRNGGAFHIHHIVSFSIKSLRSDPENLVLLCKNCHLFIHSKKNINKDYISEAA